MPIVHELRGRYLTTTRYTNKCSQMDLHWERPLQGLARGSDLDGRELAQITHVFSTTGDDLGWTVWLTQAEGELFDRYPTAELAMAGAEAALEPPR